MNFYQILHSTDKFCVTEITDSLYESIPILCDVPISYSTQFGYVEAHKNSRVWVMGMLCIFLRGSTTHLGPNFSFSTFTQPAFQKYSKSELLNFSKYADLWDGQQAIFIKNKFLLAFNSKME
jgi:hypothetical protein